MLPGEADAAVQLDISWAAFSAVSEHAALASATASAVSGPVPATSPLAAYLAAARACVTCTHRSASRCLIAWKPPTGRANWCRSCT